MRNCEHKKLHTIRHLAIAGALAALLSTAGAQTGGSGTGTSGSGTGTGTSGTTGTGTGTRSSGDTSTGTRRTTDSDTRRTGELGRSGQSGDISSADRSFITKAAKAGHKEVRLSQVALTKASSQEVRSFAQQMVQAHQTANAELASIAQTKGVNIALSSFGASDLNTPRLGSPAGSGSWDTSRSGTGTSGTGSTGSGSLGTSGSGAGTTGTGSSSGSMGSGTSGTSTSGSSATSGSGSSGMSGTSGTGMTSSGSGTYAGSGGMTSGATSEEERDIEKAVKELSQKQGQEFDREYMEKMVESHEETIELLESASRRGSDPQIQAFASRQLPIVRDHHERAEEIQKNLKK